MLAHSVYPSMLSGEGLDNYLSKGYFRMTQSVFTTNFLKFNKTYYSAIWLRLDLHSFTPTRTQTKLEKQNKKFKVTIKRFKLTPEKELLFYNYRKGVAFEASESIQHLLYEDDKCENIFDSFEVNIFDGKKLIAIGVFDVGANTSAGITCFYDHEYKKYSLGKYLIYLKIKHCKAIGLRYFYPGYFVPNYTRFDYKLEISDLGIEYLKLSDNTWNSIDNFNADQTPLKVMQTKLKVLQQKLIAKGVNCKMINYLYYDATFNETLLNIDLFDYPVFIYFIDVNKDFVIPNIVYNINIDAYQFNKCISIWESENHKNNEGLYASNLLQVLDIIVTNKNEDEIVSFICS